MRSEEKRRGFVRKFLFQIRGEKVRKKTRIAIIAYIDMEVGDEAKFPLARHKCFSI